MNDIIEEMIVKPSVIYGLYDPRDPIERIRYIGRTRQKPNLRLSSHMTDARGVTVRRQKRPVCNWVAKLLREGAKPCMRILQACDSTTDRDTERRWIANFLAAGIKLLNGTDGGDGGDTTLSPELRQLKSDITKQRWATPEGRQAMMENRAPPKTHCLHGHEFTEENTYIDPKRGSRQCKTCQRERREAAKALNPPKPRKPRQPKAPQFNKCRFCGQLFQVGGAKGRNLASVYCTRACLTASQSHGTHPCAECGTECIVRHRYCSHECYFTAKRKPDFIPVRLLQPDSPQSKKEKK